ncbi:hypothetical protein [Treponema endosymbiont of Eucomonympha sp.]|uniref:hypothetical protein n=1 Tax=Treponema endosymbiont of Eucomonympha sp. TaxID=1580831 RepID=UPI00075114FC|nr:hypothetical protein [Treponema endosymbiont of Eucomonympha sp.]
MTKFKKAAINAATIIAVAATVGASILGCDGFADEPNSDGTAAGPERKAKAARFNDGDYIFYFKNGRTAGGDCDGYSSEYGGKTTIYEWWRDDIREWEKRVKAAGATEIETNSNKYHSGYYWVSFPTNLIYGTGLRYTANSTKRGNAYFRLKGKGETRIKYTTGLNLAQANADFNWESDGNEFGLKYVREAFSTAHEGKPIPELALRIFYYYESEKSGADPLRNGGYTFERVNNDDKNLLIDASNVEWFAYDY